MSSVGKQRERRKKWGDKAVKGEWGKGERVRKIRTFGAMDVTVRAPWQQSPGRGKQMETVSGRKKQMETVPQFQTNMTWS